MGEQCWKLNKGSNRFMGLAVDRKEAIDRPDTLDK